MSVTFYLPSNETAYPACPDCGGRISWDPKPDRDCKHPVCEGYGPSMVESTPSLNLSNQNFSAFMKLVMDYEDAGWGGELDPQDILLRLSMAHYKAPQAVRAAHSEGNYHSSGLPLEVINGYCKRLEIIASLAIRRKEEIHYA